MNILLTGCGGFIGSHLLEHFLNAGHNVIGVDDFSGTGNMNNMQKVMGNVQRKRWIANFDFYAGDLKSFDFVDHVFKKNKFEHIDTICHQAAHNGVPKSLKEPLKYYKNNIDPFYYLLECAVAHEVERFIYASSSSVYNDMGTDVYPASPYAITKFCNETFAQAYSKVHGIHTIGLRYFNVFGERQINEGNYAPVIAKWVYSIKNNFPVYVAGDGHTTRDFTYVKNICLLNEALLKCQDTLILDASLGDEISLLDALNEIISVYNPSYCRDHIHYIKERPNDKKKSVGKEHIFVSSFIGDNMIDFKSGLNQMKAKHEV